MSDRRRLRGRAIGDALDLPDPVALTRGVEMLDAPVSGGSAAAEAGTLAIMVGGSKAAVEQLAQSRRAPFATSRAHEVKRVAMIAASGAAT